MTASVPPRRPPKVDTKRAKAKRACARHLEDLRRAHHESAEPVPCRPRPKGETERAAAKRACARHLKDLQRAHGEPPTDVAVSTRGLPKFVAPILEQSYCTSPAALCAELAE
jgi:hypothetical protein